MFIGCITDKGEEKRKDDKKSPEKPAVVDEITIDKSSAKTNKTKTVTPEGVTYAFNNKGELLTEGFPKVITYSMQHLMPAYKSDKKSKILSNRVP